MKKNKKGVGKKDVELLFEMGSMHNIQRGWRQHLGIDCFNVLEHSYRVIWIALILAKAEGVKDEAKIMKMALLHDLPETRVSDLSYVQKVYAQGDEDLACKEMLKGTVVSDLYKTYCQYENRDSIEAKIVKDADNLDVDLEMKEFEERGSQLPKKWAKFRQMVRDEKLYTQSAKDLWDVLQGCDVADWHMTINKWVKIKTAGL